MSPRPPHDDPLHPLQLIRLRYQHAANALMLKLINFHLLTQKYSADQPRVPAGVPEGGQWAGNNHPAEGTGRPPVPARVQVTRDSTGTAPWKERVDGRTTDGTLVSREVTYRDGSKVLAEYDPSAKSGFDSRYTVTNADGSVFTFTNSGGVQTIADGKTGQVISQTQMTPQGPEPMPQVVLTGQPLPAPPLLPGGPNKVEGAVSAALQLLGVLNALRGLPDATPFEADPHPNAMIAAIASWRAISSIPDRPTLISFGSASLIANRPNRFAPGSATSSLGQTMLGIRRCGMRARMGCRPMGRASAPMSM